MPGGCCARSCHRGEPVFSHDYYSRGLFFDDEACVHQPCDIRLVGLHCTAGYILGVDPTEAPPRIATNDTHEKPSYSGPVRVQSKRAVMRTGNSSQMLI